MFAMRLKGTPQYFRDLRTSRLSSALLVFCIMCTAPIAVADEITIAQNLVNPSSEFINADINTDSPSLPEIDTAQTFTAAEAATITTVSLLLNWGPQVAEGLVIDIRNTVAGVPVESDSSVLGQVALSQSSIAGTQNNGYVTFDFTSFGIAVVPGEVLAIVAEATRDPSEASYDAFGWAGNFSSYSGGEEFQRTDSASYFLTWTPQFSGTAELGFQVCGETTSTGSECGSLPGSQIPSSPAPEPTMIFFVLFGVVVGGVVKHHQKRAAQ
jgi:hypothetical protein